MVKGVSRQVIVVRGKDQALFEQAIFILKDKVTAGEGVSDDALLKEARRLMSAAPKSVSRIPAAVWACGGALLTAAVWLLTALL